MLHLVEKEPSLVATAGSLRYYVQSAPIVEQAVQNVLELFYKLYLVENDIGRRAVFRDTPPNVRKQSIRIPEAFVRSIVKGDFDDVVFLHAMLDEILVKQVQQEKRLPAASHARDDFYQPVAPPFHEPSQVSVSFYYHAGHSPILCIATLLPITIPWHHVMHTSKLRQSTVLTNSKRRAAPLSANTRGTAGRGTEARPSCAPLRYALFLR